MTAMTTMATTAMIAMSQPELRPDDSEAGVTDGEGCADVGSGAGSADDVVGAGLGAAEVGEGVGEVAA